MRKKDIADLDTSSESHGLVASQQAMKRGWVSRFSVLVLVALLSLFILVGLATHSGSKTEAISLLPALVVLVTLATISSFFASLWIVQLRRPMNCLHLRRDELVHTTLCGLRTNAYSIKDVAAFEYEGKRKTAFRTFPPLLFLRLTNGHTFLALSGLCATVRRDKVEETLTLEETGTLLNKLLALEQSSPVYSRKTDV